MKLARIGSEPARVHEGDVAAVSDDDVVEDGDARQLAAGESLGECDVQQVRPDGLRA